MRKLVCCPFLYVGFGGVTDALIAMMEWVNDAKLQEIIRTVSISPHLIRVRMIAEKVRKGHTATSRLRALG